MTPGYHITEQLYHSTNSVVYRAIRQSDTCPVILKCITEDYPIPERVAWFKREYEVTRTVNLPGVIRVYSLEYDQHRWCIVLEDFGGNSLSLLKIAGTLDMLTFLNLAMDITDIVAQVHSLCFKVCNCLLHRRVRGHCYRRITP